MNNQKENKMAVMPMRRLVYSMSLPLMVSLLVQSLYNIVDGIFVARTGEDALTATSLAYPVQLFMVAVSVGTSVGLNALVSRLLGAKKYEEANRAATTGLILSLISTGVFMLLGIFGTEAFIRMFTQDEVTGALCKQYLQICMIFCLGIFMETLAQRLLQAVGNTFLSMVSLVAGALTNIILDPIMIFGLFHFPALGIRGAAIATVIGQWVGAIVALTLNKMKNKEIHFEFRNYKLEASSVKAVYRVGVPTIVTQAMGSIMLSAANAILMSVSSTAVAFFGVYYKLQNFLLMPMNGLGQAAIPIVGFNYGAKNETRIKSVLNVMIPTAIGFSLAAALIFELFPDRLLGLFSAGEAMLAMGVPALRIIAVTFVCSSVTTVLGYFASGLGNGMVNMCGTALRQFVLFIPLLYLLTRSGTADHAWYAMWVSEGVSVIISILLVRREMKKKVGGWSASPEPDKAGSGKAFS